MQLRLAIPTLQRTSARNTRVESVEWSLLLFFHIVVVLRIRLGNIVRLRHVFFVARLAAVRKQGYRFCSRSVNLEAHAVPGACSGLKWSQWNQGHRLTHTHARTHARTHTHTHEHEDKLRLAFIVLSRIVEATP